MYLLSYFYKNAIKDDDSKICGKDCDKKEYDETLQLIVELNKLITTYQDDEKHKKFFDKHQETFERLRATLESTCVMMSTVYVMFPKYDYGNVRANGYRSFFAIIRKCMVTIKRQINNHMNCFLINRLRYEYALLQYIECLVQLVVIAKYLIQMMIINNESGTLFLSPEKNIDVYRKIMDCYENLNCDIFYGQCLGFYLCESCQVMAKILCSIQLGMGQAMTMPRSDLEMFVSTVVNGAHSFMAEHKRAAQMTLLYPQATVKFCKQFWNLVDHPYLVSWAKFVLPAMPVIRVMSLQPFDLKINKFNSTKEFVDIYPPVPRQEPGEEKPVAKEVRIRLLSNKFRYGMSYVSNVSTSTQSNGTAPSTTTNKPASANIIDNNTATAAASGATSDGMNKAEYPPSQYLLFHIHGGGFVAQSAQSHDSYLRQWAIYLDCPVVSVDYSHAPEHPYPMAHNECFYAYVWCLLNLSELGCDPDHTNIVLCGDSAGANLALGVTIHALISDIAPPYALLLAYPTTLIDFIPSPARMLGVLDPILPLGVLARCLLAYGGVNEDILTHQVSQLSLDVETDTTNNSKKKMEKGFIQEDTYDSSGAKIFQSVDKSLSPIVLLEHAKLPNDPIMSPLIAEEHILARMPQTTIYASEFDPLLDDSVEFCKKVARSYVKNGGDADYVYDRYKLHVMEGLPHGFLSMASPVTKECLSAAKKCLEAIKTMMTPPASSLYDTDRIYSSDYTMCDLKSSNNSSQNNSSHLINVENASQSDTSELWTVVNKK